MCLDAIALSLRKGRSWKNSKLGLSMVFSLVIHLILEPFECSILKLTKLWRLARLKDRLGDQRRGEWEMIKFFSNRMTSQTRRTRSDNQNHTLRTQPSVCQNNVATEVLLVIGTNTTSSLTPTRTRQRKRLGSWLSGMGG
jgi:hypothetical protein